MSSSIQIFKVKTGWKLDIYSDKSLIYTSTYKISVECISNAMRKSLQYNFDGFDIDKKISKKKYQLPINNLEKTIYDLISKSPMNGKQLRYTIANDVYSHMKVLDCIKSNIGILWTATRVKKNEIRYSAIKNN